jgi:hypothetical protein
MVASGRSASQSGHIHSEERVSVVQEVGSPLSGVSMGRRTGGLLEKMENLLPLPGIKSRFLGLAHFLMTTPTTISRLSLEVLPNPSEDANTRCSTYDVQTSGLPLIPLLA